MSPNDSVLEEARASLEEGDLERAREALRRAVEQNPGDSSALVDLGYLALGAGDADEAADLFRQALERDSGNIDALRALATIHGRAGRGEDALEAASAVAEAQPDDPLAAIEVADLALELGRLEEAEAAFRRLRSLDDDPEHEVYAYHGLVEVELRRERWRRALDLAVDATRVDRLGRTTDILAFVVSQVFGEADRPAPERTEIEDALARSRAEHRRLHLEVL
ncbi:MAG TPA: tetratricopeptide repeat protein [Gaiellaceae bacterium]